MHSWTPYAFVRIVSFFIAGIVLGIYQPDFIPQHIATIALMGLVAVYLFLTWIMKGEGRSLLAGTLGLLAIGVSGYVNTLVHTDSQRPDHFMHVTGPIDKYYAVISGYSEKKEKSWKAEAKVQQVYYQGTWHECSGKVLLYFARNDFEEPFRYGDKLLINGSPRELQPPANPGEFNYKRFLTFRKIYHQHFIPAHQVLLLSNDPASNFLSLSYRVRAWAERVLEKYISGEQERAVAGALLLGVKDGLDNELVQAYASSGAMHVLAVSGLHVGIIYLIISVLVKPLDKVRHGKWLLALVGIGALWSYAFITGLSPSVLRAVTMFSVMALSKPLNYKTNIYNTLGVAAFILLLWEPYLIMSVGFQLSFLAVIGIVYMQPKLYWLWSPNHLLWDKVWQITCVSIAAQLATCSLGLLYFHQFPVYFLVSNLFVIPGAIISVVLGTLLLLISFFDPVATVIGFILEFFLWVLNNLVFWVEQLPFSLINNIYITTFQTWLLMGMLVSALLLLHFRRFVFMVVILFCAIALGLMHWYHYYGEVRPEKFVVYHVAGKTAMEWSSRGKSFLRADSTLLNDAERIRFHVRPNRLISGIHHSSTALPFMRSFQGGYLFVWSNKIIVQLTSESFSLPEGLKVDYIVISNNSIRNVSTLDQVTCKTIIIDSSNTFYTASKILNQAATLNLPVYSVLHQGAFVIKL